MNKADKILDKKTWVKEELDRRLPPEQADRIWKAARERLEEYLLRYADIPKGEHAHTDSSIFPAAAIYLSMKDAIGEEEAFEIMDLFSVHLTEGPAAMLSKVMLIPGMRDLFIKMWDPMTKKMFGSASGFANRFYENSKGEYRMDITSCPYSRYLTELGCPEITKIFCTNDDRTYGDLPGLEFLRTKTIGRGGDCCDFYIRKKDIVYRTEISDAKWWAYDIPGNIGWIAYFAGFAHLIRKGRYSDVAMTAVPAALMATGVCELINERIQGLDRELPERRLLRGFGALTLGGITGAIAGASGLMTSPEKKTSALMSAGGGLCAIFAGLLYKGYKRM